MASGMVYAIEGYLMKMYGMDAEWIPYVLEQALFAIANNDAGIDHWSHLKGFVFGFIYKDLPFYISVKNGSIFITVKSPH